jgi:NAD(P)-dependent dehydrogenase (short-subunit alcohol dehydrogenase family)
MDGKRVVLTGCVANIGRATALRFAADGAALFLVDRDPRVADTAAQAREAGARAGHAVADVGDEAQVIATLAEAARFLGGIDAIVNNAGVQLSGEIESFSVEDWDLTMAVNARSCFLFAKHGVPHLREAGGGAIVNTSSVAGVRGGPPSLAAYSASKGAIVTFTKVLAREVGRWNIRVNALCPGWVDTPFNDPVIEYLGGREAVDRSVRETVPLGRQGTADEIAGAMRFLVSDDSAYMTGQALVVDGGAG